MRTTLIAERKNRNMSQATVAKITNLSEIYIRKLEAGTRNPSVSTILKFEQLYKKSMQELFPDIFLNN